MDYKILVSLDSTILLMLKLYFHFILGLHEKKMVKHEYKIFLLLFVAGCQDPGDVNGLNRNPPRSTRTFSPREFIDFACQGGNECVRGGGRITCQSDGSWDRDIRQIPQCSSKSLSCRKFMVLYKRLSEQPDGINRCQKTT